METLKDNAYQTPWGGKRQKLAIAYRPIVISDCQIHHCNSHNGLILDHNKIYKFDN